MNEAPLPVPAGIFPLVVVAVLSQIRDGQLRGRHDEVVEAMLSGLWDGWRGVGGRYDPHRRMPAPLRGLLLASPGAWIGLLDAASAAAARCSGTKMHSMKNLNEALCLIKRVLLKKNSIKLYDIYQEKNTIDDFINSSLRASLVSFDIFDTLLVRCIGAPINLFDAMATRLALTDPVLGMHFSQARIEAERLAREAARQSGACDVTLADIYRQLTEMLPADGLDAAIALECELEVASIQADPQVQAAYNLLRTRGARIVLTSDMYLPRACILQMLQKCGIAGFEKLFISGEDGVAKADGSVWPRVRSDMSLVHGNVIVHLGDNPFADGKIARKSGVIPFLLSPPARRAPGTRYPKAGNWLEDACHALLRQSLVRHRDDQEIDPYWLELGHLVLLPTVLGMAGFVHAMGRRETGGRVFFLARDGLIIQKAYEAAWQQPDEMPSKYVWSSRRCLNLAVIDTIDDDVLHFLCSTACAEAPEDYLRRIDLDPDDERIHSILRQHFPHPHRIVNTAEARQRLRALFGDLHMPIRQRAEIERQALMVHLQDVGLFAGPALVVDLGWHGTLQRSLIALGQMATGRRPQLAGAYVGTFANRAQTAAGERMRSVGWLFEDGCPDQTDRLVRKGVEVVELLFSAPERGIRHIEIGADGRPRPVRILQPEEQARFAIATRLHTIVEEAATALRPFLTEAAVDPLRAMALRNLAVLLEQPSGADADRFRMIAHAEGFGAARYRPIVTPVPRFAGPRALQNAWRLSYWKPGFLAGLPLWQRAEWEVHGALQWRIRTARQRWWKLHDVLRRRLRLAR